MPHLVTKREISRRAGIADGAKPILCKVFGGVGRHPCKATVVGVNGPERDKVGAISVSQPVYFVEYAVVGFGDGVQVCVHVDFHIVGFVRIDETNTLGDPGVLVCGVGLVDG